MVQTTDLSCTTVEQVENKIMQHVGARRIRLREFFKDFDPLRHYKVTRSQFERLLDVATLVITHSEFELLVQKYGIRETGEINYKEFCDTIEEVFRTPHLETQPLVNPPPPGAILPPRFMPQAVNEEKKMKELMERMTLLVKTRGFVFKYCFQDYDPLRSGCLTDSQFKRAFPFKNFTTEEIALVADRYSNGKGSVNYMAIHNAITKNTFAQEPPPPTSKMILRTDNRVWDQQTLAPERKLQALVVMKRIRIREFFEDYDKLRKGVTTRQQAHAVFHGVLGVTIPAGDWEKLCETYCREDGLFNYAALCDVIDEAFAAKGLEKAPTRRINLPDADTTEAARRNRMQLDVNETAAIVKLETDIRRQVKQKRKLLLPTFQDFDPSNRGHITKSQFTRAMSMLGFEMASWEVDTLALKYCNVGNVRDFDYREFTANVDPPSDVRDRLVAMSDESTYFDKKGRIVGSPQRNHRTTPL